MGEGEALMRFSSIRKSSAMLAIQSKVAGFLENRLGTSLGGVTSTEFYAFSTMCLTRR